MSTRKVKLEEKVKSVREAEQKGFTETAVKHNISSRQIYRWRDKLQTGGSKALSYGAKIDPELKSLKERNRQLKKLVAKPSLTVEIKEELLKKISLHTVKNF